MNDKIRIAPLVIVLLISTSAWAAHSQQQYPSANTRHRVVDSGKGEATNDALDGGHSSGTDADTGKDVGTGGNTNSVNNNQNDPQQQQQAWDDPFGNANNPILYMQSNRTPAYEDMRIIFIYVAFLTGYVAFLIIFPGIRQGKFSTLLSVTVSLFVGVIILTSVLGTDWQRAHATISSPYRAFSKERISADLSVKIGLKSVNITLRAHQSHQPHNHNQQHHQQQQQEGTYYYNDDINYNERFYWIEPTEMRQEFHKALERGLPYPILTVAEYLSQDEGGFSWSRKYRQAGYYADQLLWMAFATWIVMNVLLCAAPKYGVYAMLMVGTIMLGTNLLYWLLVPNNKHQLVIPFEGHYLTFKFGWSYWMVMIAGTTSIFIGACFLICFKLYPHYIFTTILDIEYDNHHQHRRLNYAPLSSSTMSSCPTSSNPSSSAPSPISSHYNTPNNRTIQHQANIKVKEPTSEAHQRPASASFESQNSLSSSANSSVTRRASSITSEARQQRLLLEKKQLQQLSVASLWSQDNSKTMQLTAKDDSTVQHHDEPNQQSQKSKIVRHKHHDRGTNKHQKYQLQRYHNDEFDVANNHKTSTTFISPRDSVLVLNNSISRDNRDNTGDRTEAAWIKKQQSKRETD